MQLSIDTSFLSRNTSHNGGLSSEAGILIGKLVRGHIARMHQVTGTLRVQEHATFCRICIGSINVCNNLLT